MLSLRHPVGASCVDYFMSRDGELVTSTANPGFAQAVADESQGAPLAIRLTDLPATGQTGAAANLLASELHFVAPTTRGWPWSGTCGFCFRREMIEILFRRTPHLKQQLDAYLIGGINCLTGSVLIDRPLVVYRQHGANVFARHPYLANFRLYDSSVQRVAAATTAEEIIKTFVFVSDELARRLERSDLFIEAIETLSAIWSPQPRKSVTRAYMRAFLKANAAMLVAAFGQQHYADWVAARYSWHYSWRYFAASCIARATRSLARARAPLRPSRAKKRMDRKLGAA
jgi:hypothetical protein